MSDDGSGVDKVGVGVGVKSLDGRRGERRVRLKRLWVDVCGVEHGGVVDVSGIRWGCQIWPGLGDCVGISMRL